MKNNGRTILFWARFWSYGLISVLFLTCLIIGVISLKTDNATLAGIALILIPSTAAVVSGVYFLIGIIKENIVVHCVWQDLSRKKMDPYSNEWTKNEKRKFKIFSITIIVIGVLLLTAYICVI